MLALGVDHRSAPTSVPRGRGLRGRADAQVRARSAEGRCSGRANSSLLSTCNRVELYTAAEADLARRESALAGFLAKFHDVPVEMLGRHPGRARDDAAVAHLFRVSPPPWRAWAPGEGQILGQVRDAEQARHRLQGRRADPASPSSAGPCVLGSRVPQRH